MKLRGYRCRSASGSDVQRGLRLANAAASRKRNQPMLAYERCNLFELTFAPDEAG